MKLMPFILFIILFFNGCIVKQSAPQRGQKQPTSAYNLPNKYNTPNMRQFNIQDRTNNGFAYPTQQQVVSKSDKQLQGLIEGNNSNSNSMQEIHTLDTKNVPISNSKDEIVMTQDKSSTILPSIGEIEVVDATKNTNSVSSLDKNIINAEMMGIYGDFTYPVSIRKSHKYRKTIAQTTDEIQTTNKIQNKIDNTKQKNIKKIKPSPAIKSAATLNSQVQNLSTKKSIKVRKKLSKTLKQTPQGTL